MPCKPVLVIKRTNKERLVEATKRAFDSIKAHEGCKLEAYRDQGGRWTIGYGATGGSIRQGVTWTQEQADADLKGRLEVLSRLISQKIKVMLSQPQFDALISFVYNIGINNFAESGVLRLVNTKQYKAAADRMLKWNKVAIDGVLTVSEGLTARREAERAMFLAAL